MAKMEVYPEDLDVALPILWSVEPRVIVEIGTYFGGSAEFWQAEFNPEILVTIDNIRRVTLDFCHQIVAPSQDIETLSEVMGLLGHRSIDLLFIDGSHLYEDVKRDYELYSRLVRRGGLIVFHDILYRNDKNDVPTLWKELKRRYHYIEIAQHQNTSGLGIIRWGAPFERTRFGNVT